MSAVDDRAAIDKGRALVHAWWASGRGAYTLSHEGPAALTTLCDLAERLIRENAELQEWGERCQKVAHERGTIIDKMHEREHKLKEELARLKKAQDGLLSLALEEFNR